MTNPTIAKVLIFIATLFFAVLPLYLTDFCDVIYDGALLILATTFSADAAFSCYNPQNRHNNLTLALGLASLMLTAMSIAQYAPIAYDLRAEKKAVADSILTKDVAPIRDFETRREVDERTLHNSSMTVFGMSILMELCAIVVVEA